MSTYVITGGAGFVGSNIAHHLLRRGETVYLFDNLHRKGSPLNQKRLVEEGAHFTKGDIRNREDLEKTERFDVLIECSAEPSVSAGMSGDTNYLFDTNVLGTYNCLDLVRKRGAKLIFLSTSRVYSMRALQNVPLGEDESKFYLKDIPEDLEGLSTQGIAKNFSTHAPRTIYGTTKLCSELLVQEWAAQFGIPSLINRCGVIAGPWQMGKVDQGIVSLWVASHYFNIPLCYKG